MRRVVAVVVGLVVVGSACSSSGESGGSGVSSPVSGSGVTVVESLTGLELVLDGEPPSTTVSADVDEQTAAEVVHWEDQTWLSCLAELPDCDGSVFGKTTRGSFLNGRMSVFGGWSEQGHSIKPGAREPEFRVVWSRKSPTNPDVVLVLSCSRSYNVIVGRDGAVVDDTSPMHLFLHRVERSSDGGFLIALREEIDRYQPDGEGGDLCLEYSGDEPSAELVELLQ